MIEIGLQKKLQGAAGTFQLSFDAKIEAGELVTLYGASGVGKTSIFRMICGLLAPDAGRVQFEQEIWFDKAKKIHVKPQHRNIGMVFQDYSLFPNMNVRENLAYALEKNQSKEIIDELLELAELGQLADTKPNLLSGGQKQRVALARALVRKPKLLLLDEPLSALDLEMQSKMQDYILKFHKEFNLTTILISHDLLEVAKMSKRVLLLENGKITQDGTPEVVLPMERLMGFLKETKHRN
ncbi:ATP-binding cassette domain-containing protein [Algoriphagus halophytocola]|uniref:ABC transporter ATP-binding protein n=1 Tax=Algoriphagus halophytocola TaxID=2991499 RepID=UPI0022DDBD4A|nr:ATP-binding cassette domain-containing protein [Algoriphagus sp. TR-M9]WBL44747.1 ATP-binding cassette domain-containing protein [Algoriphagus sp. TR-M9]